MEKKTLHIIPHSHWDREWYLPFEKHRIRLIQLFDTLISLMEKDPAYTYYHMDGQFIVIEDYLEIRPEMKERLLSLIRAGRIQIGPWYVLQDEYLTSGESNIRNMLYGLKLCKDIGADPVMTGYFPDAFGNISQAPQILRGFGIDNAVFGRGLNDIGSDNRIVKQQGITGSELLWQSPDGSEVIGVLFANWYHNAMELPADREALAARVEAIVNSASRFSATPELLGMNGCDHQPVQTDLSAVIKAANEVQDRVNVRQSNFKEYIEKIRPYKDSFAVHRGEIAGQLTSGICLLTDTASCRVDIKQLNQRVQNLLTRKTEPLNAFSFVNGDTYDRDYYLYAWRKLMQNHPHDSICSCSDDAIYEEMKVRFAKSEQVGEALRDKAMDYLVGNADTKDGAEKNLLVFCAEPGQSHVTVEAYADYPEDTEVTDISVTDEYGAEIPAEIRKCGRTFTYTLPDDRFRQPKFVKRFALRFRLATDGSIGTRLLPVVPKASSKKTAVTFENNTLENEYLSLRFTDSHEDASFMLTDKQSGRVMGPCNVFEDTKDGGNTYNFGTVDGDKPILSFGGHAVFSVSETPYGKTVSVSLTLGEEDIVSSITLYDGEKQVAIKTTVTNRGENHRIRALFTTETDTDTVYAAGQFDLVPRTITPWEGWKNPSNTQRAEQFVMLEDENGGLICAHKGLDAYEVLRDGHNTLALTLLRSVGEIGDWGDFPTPLAQCKGTYTMSYALFSYTPEEAEQAVGDAYTYCSNAVLAHDIDRQAGTIPAVQTLVTSTEPLLRMSALKRAEDGDALILRLYYIGDDEKTIPVTFGKQVHTVALAGMDEQIRETLPMTDGTVSLRVTAKKIITLRLGIQK